MALSRSDYLRSAMSFAGCRQGDARHKNIVRIFNTEKPDGGALGINDPWCAAFVSAIAISCGYTRSNFPLSYNVGTMITLAKRIGIWVESDAYTPKPGDLIIYDWSDNGVGENTDGASHVGVVTSVSGRNITVLEGNKGTTKSCAYRSMVVNGRYIRGYILPKYDNESGNSGSDSSAKIIASGYVLPSDGLNVRTGPGTSNRRITGLSKGTKVDCYATKSVNGQTWWAINPGTSRWICASGFVAERGTPKVYGSGVVSAAIGLNVRSGPGTGYRKTRALRKGTTVQCYGTRGSWWAINSAMTEWVCASWIRKN